MAKVRFLILLALLLIALIAPAFAVEEETPIDDIEKQEQQEDEEDQQEEEEYKSETKAEEDGYVHLVIRRKFVNKTFFATIPSLVQVQIYNLGTATAKKVKVVDTYPDTFADFIEKYSFDKIAPNDFVSREYWMTPMYPGKITIPRITYTYGGSREYYYDDDEEKDDRVHGYGDVEVNSFVETTNEYYKRIAPHGKDWAIVGVSSFLACALPFIFYRKN